MIRRWRVVAIYAPGPKRTPVWDSKGRYSGFTIKEIPSSAAGLEFKFIVDATDEVEAVVAIRRAGWFLAETSKQFGFVAEAIE